MEQPIANRSSGRDPDWQQAKGAQVRAVAKPISAERQVERPANAVWVVAGHSTLTNELLVGALHERGVGARLIEPANLSGLADCGDVVLGRLDVRRTLDGVEDGIWELRRVERPGIRVLNPAPSLIACHDKLQTALRLGRLGVPHPATAHVDWDTPPPRIECPVVVKPRFGSWGRDVWLCESRRQLERCLRRLRDRTWFRRQGALVQALVPPAGFDLRVVVAGGRVVGAIERVAAAGEWRTNIALGGSRRAATPTPEACVLATYAAAAVAGDLVGVDLLPLANGDYVVLEVNGAVEMTTDYSLAGRDVFEEVAKAVACDETAIDVGATGFGG
jgi:[lysine-biosynthesis-protein LysW]--L-2-aminoadipate ligase